jgi:cytochrome c oxidase cbb3-type subunit 2
MRAVVAGVAVIAATYVYFLLFAEFALLALAQTDSGAGASVGTIMAVLGAGGVAGSFAAARAFSFARLKRSLAAGFALCGVAALAALFTRGGVGFATAAGAVGLGMGWTTVTLAAGLRGIVGENRLGWWCGLGTGVAYALCNVPAVFETSPVNQALIAAAAMLAGLSATRWLDVRAVEPRRDGDFSPLRVAGWLVVLLALVWLDSAAFYVIQHAPALKSSTWEGAWQLWGNALTHLGAALATGWALDRGWTGRVAGAAGALLVIACLLLTTRGASGGASVAYTAGVSLYSTVLVFYPARSGRAFVAGLLYAAAGWGGSALGIGMAQNLAEIPLWFLAVASAAIGVALGVRWRVLPTAAVVLMAGAIVPGVRAEADPLVQLGREVYVSEGCIHCHSQFVRSRIAAEVERWGPAQSLASTLKASPPLLGNRRQGPDLAEVGNRRSSDWQQLHLINPRALVPGSRMPDYDYLFADGDPRGEALVAYLGSLGRETLAARVAASATWRPTAAAGAVPDGRSGRLFAELCSGCHGPNGQGDGVLVDELSVRPPDFSRDAWRRAGDGSAEVVARIIKFGVPGTPMAGHEYLSDADVVALARHVIALHSAPPNTP